MTSPSAEPPPAPPASACAALRALVRKEVGAYFHSPAAYIVTVVWVLISGYLFAQPLFLTNLSTIDTFVDMAPLLLVFLVPAVTMRLFSEETKAGTLEILETFPVTLDQILAAKYLAALAVIAFSLGATLAYPAAVAALGTLDYGAAFGAYLGLFLTGALFAAAGTLASALTRNQVIAFLSGMLPCFAFFLLGKVESWTPPMLQPLTSFLGVDGHLANLGRGVLDLRDLLYFPTLAAFFLYLARWCLEARRD